MSGSKTFEELPVWQAGRDLVRRVYDFTRASPAAGDRGFCDQIQRAAISVTNNIAEGHERGTTVELVVFLFYAKGSVGEVRSMLWNAEDLRYLPAATAAELRALAGNISHQLHGWIASMQTPDFNPGPKHHREPPAGLRRWELYLEQQGIVRLANGRHIQIARTERVGGREEREEQNGITEERETGSAGPWRATATPRPYSFSPIQSPFRLFPFFRPSVIPYIPLFRCSVILPILFFRLSPPPSRFVRFSAPPHLLPLSRPSACPSAPPRL